MSDGRDLSGNLSAPDSSTGNKPDEKLTRTYTEDEVTNKLKGQGKVIDDLKVKLEKYQKADEDAKKRTDEDAKKKLEEQGQFKILLEQEQSARSRLEQQIASMTEREAKRFEAVTSENAKRLEKLPKILRELVPAGLDPDATTVQIARLESMVQTRDVYQGGGRNKERSPEDLFKPIVGWQKGKEGGK